MKYIALISSLILYTMCFIATLEILLTKNTVILTVYNLLYLISSALGFALIPYILFIVVILIIIGPYYIFK